MSALNSGWFIICPPVLLVDCSGHVRAAGHLEGFDGRKPATSQDDQWSKVGGWVGGEGQWLAMLVLL